jgi:hypothetical protein
MNTKRALMASGLVLLASASAHATNFSYTNLGVEVGRLSFDEQIDFEGEIYRGLTYMNISGSYQFTENFALGFTNTAASNRGRTTDVTEYGFMVVGYFPFAVSPAMDIIPFVGYAWQEAEACHFNLCSVADDSDLVYGVNLRTWVVPNQFELGVGYMDSDLETLESVISLTGAYWFDPYNRVSIRHSVGDLDKTTTIGYSFVW